MKQQLELRNNKCWLRLKLIMMLKLLNWLLRKKTNKQQKKRSMIKLQPNSKLHHTQTLKKKSLLKLKLLPKERRMQRQLLKKLSKMHNNF
jgi:hypothetical protein